MLTIDESEIAGPGAGAYPGDGRSSFRRILVPVRWPGESGPALAVAARICGTTGGVLRLVHVRACDPPWPIARVREGAIVLVEPIVGRSVMERLNGELEMSTK